MDLAVGVVGFENDAVGVGGIARGEGGAEAWPDD